MPEDILTKLIHFSGIYRDCWDGCPVALGPCCSWSFRGLILQATALHAWGVPCQRTPRVHVCKQRKLGFSYLTGSSHFQRCTQIPVWWHNVYPRSTPVGEFPGCTSANTQDLAPEALDHLPRAAGEHEQPPDPLKANRCQPRKSSTSYY